MPKFSLDQDVAMKSTPGQSPSRRKKKDDLYEKLGSQFIKPKTRQGEMVIGCPVYSGSVKKTELPDHALNEHDFHKRLRFEELKKVKLEEMCSWKQKDIKGIKKSSYIKEIQKKNEGILVVAQKESLEKLEVYRDRFPLLGLRKTLNKLRIIIQLDAYAIQSSKIFENISIFVIIVNSFVMMIQDPTAEQSTFFNVCENIFLALYSVEMIVKITGLGFIFGKSSYLRDAWNILDFVIVISSYPALFTDPDSTEEGGFSLSGLRSFRVMRPLKTISSVKGLKILVQALARAMPVLGNTIVILLFFFAIFAIAGTNLMSGNLMNRCINIQTGIMQPIDEPLCGGQECPGGYFCGRTNENPNFGVTNFDNVMYSLLCVFQSVTLEGWSDIQKQMQKAYTYWIFVYFLPLVFIGAFFLLNLTLAVINSEFTKAHKEHITNEQKHQTASKQINMDNEIDILNSKDEMSISQFITARIYAKKMIAFLKSRQAAKKLEKEKMMHIKEKQNAVAQAKRRIPDQSSQSSKMSNLKGQHMIPNNLKPPKKNGQDIIIEDAAEHHDEQSDQDQLEKDIQDFLKNSKIQMQRQSHLGNLQKSDDFKNRAELDGGMPTMKGNIGPTSKFMNNGNNDFASQQKNLFSRMAEDFAIDKIIPLQETVKSNEDIGYSNNSFNLSLHNEDIKSNYSNSEHHRSVPNKNHGDLDVPGLGNGNENESSELVTSDSNFDMPGSDIPKNGEDISIPTKKSKNAKQDISRAFKRLLIKNNQRTVCNSHNDRSADESTKFGGSPRRDQDAETNNSEIEKKFAKKKNRRVMNSKAYKEDDLLLENRKSNKVDSNYNFGKDDKKTIQISESINTKRPNDPFKGINPLTEKVAIKKDLQYQGTSTNDVFYIRYLQQNQMQPLEENQFLMLPKELQPHEDPDFIDTSCFKPAFAPYQGKVVYDIDPEESEYTQSDEIVNDDALFDEEQPFETTASIAYREMLKQLPTGELAKRSDIMVTSTLSISMFPKDKRIIMCKKRAHMNNHMIREYIDEKNAFNALVKEHMYQNPIIKEKQKEYTDVYMKSFIERCEFETSETLQKFKKHVKILNSNKKLQKPVDENVKKAERLKHQQNVTRVNKKGVPKFDRELAQKLLEGKLHDPDEEEEENTKPFSMDHGKSVYAKNKQELEKQHQIENFHQKAKNIITHYEHQRIKFTDEIPSEVRKQLDLPEKMGIYELNFKRIKEQDYKLKRQRPLWSGQDIFQNKLDHSKSEYIVEHINRIRTWPTGLLGIYKRMRFLLRQMVRSSLFDSSMTFFVFLNTITLSIDHYGILPETTEILDTFNVYFTWIFIFEMFSKLLAIGVVKYCSDRMNYLDGSVVILSIFEMIMESILSGSGGGLGAFKTVRMLRTFRVFRIARLLRAMQSMQTIVGVIVKSYKSFIYITMLMFLFVIIYSLLAMQIFGGKMNYEDGVPRGNYDKFEIAFITVFQVLTMENWQQVMFDSMRSDLLDSYVVAVYYISWIFLGNFILLNLFLAILLDSFLEEEEEAGDEEDIMAERQRKALNKAEKRKRADSNKLFMDLQNPKIAEAENMDPSKLFFGEQKVASEGEDLEDLDEEQILQIYKEDGLIQKSKDELREIKNFIDIECEASCYLLMKENKFRIYMYKLKIAWFFEPIVQVLIAFTSLKLALDTYIKSGESENLDNISQYTDIVFNLLFIIEMTIKICALGFVMDKGSYLRESWNRLDFFIVMSSIIDMSASGLNIPIIKLLRMLRVLRPLRFINHNKDLRMIVVALLESMNHIINVMIVIAVVYLIFAIVGVSLFGGKFFYCNIDMYNIQSEQECLLQLGQWMRWDFNFDNVKEAMLTLYVVASLEAWPDIMYQALDMTDNDVGPTLENSMWSMWFFVIFILFGSFFFLNFFIGVLFLKFNQAQRDEQKGFSEEDLAWQDIQKMIVTSQPDYESTNVPDQQWRSWFHDLVISNKFQNVITLAILANMLQMALLHEDQGKGFTLFMDFSNYVFAAIFIVEAVLKLIAFGKSYFQNSWNKFDFFVVVASILDVLIKFMEKFISAGSGSSDGGFLAVAPQIARIMRVLRVMRVVRLASKAEGLQAILQTVSFSITPLSNVVILLMLIFLMCAILGNFLFNQIKYGAFMDDYTNFTRFDNAFLLLFSLSTGENWPWIMFDCSRTEQEGCIVGETCGESPWSYFYFMMIILVCSYVMLNLFILVILQQFEKYYLSDNNMLQMFKEDKEVFMQVWKQFTQAKFKCKKIKEKHLPDFFRQLGDIGNEETTLGFNRDRVDDGDLNKNLLRMGIKSDMGSIYFNELLYRCMRRRYGNMKINKKMQIIELRTQYKIFLLTLKEKNMSQKKINNDDIYNNIIKKENGVNPFLTVMNFKITFKTWLKFAKQKIREEKKGDDNEYDDSSIDDQNKKPISVQIEIEKFWSCTSEEDSEGEQGEKSMNSVNLKGSAYHQSRHGKTLNNIQSNNNMLSGRKRKIKNHLTIFEKKMTQKFKQLTAEQQFKQQTEKAAMNASSKQPIDGLTNEQKNKAANKIKAMMQQSRQSQL